MQRFVNRTSEVAKLEALWEGPGLQLAILYGRRRLGKSYLLQHVWQRRVGVRFQATQATSEVIRRALLEEARSTLKDASLTDADRPNWRSVFRYFLERGTHEQLFLILDEFGYIVAADPEVPSIIQALWTEFAGRSRLRLVLCGSQVTMMRSLTEQARPLHGHTTYTKLVQPLTYRDAAEFIAPARWPTRDTLMLYGCLGGSGRYLDFVRGTDSFQDNLIRLVIDEGPLYEEGSNILMLEEGIREPASYNSVLTAIAGGATEWGEILNQSKVGSGALQNVLDTMKNILLIEREIPFLGDPGKGIWQISDNFLRFWFRFIEPNISARRNQRANLFWSSKIEPKLTDYMGWRVFEDICRSWVRTRGDRLPWPGNVEDVGRWWRRDGQLEIDVVARLDNKRYAFGSCKWNSKPMDGGDLTDLMRAVDQLPEEKWRRDAHYMLFSLSGFDGALEDRAKEQGVLLVSGEDLLVS